MKTSLLLLSLISAGAWANSTIKFVAKTNGPGITVEGEVKNPQVKIDMNKLEATTLSIDAMDLETGMERRDKHLHEKVFSAKKVGDAKIEYAVKKITCVKEATLCDSLGTLTIKGVSKELPMKVAIDQKAKTLSGTALVSLQDYQLVAPSFMGVTVEDKVEVSFKVDAE